MRLARDLYGLAASAQPLPSERDQNFRLATERGDFVLKIAGPDESADVLDLQNAALFWLAERAPELPLPRLVRSRSGDATCEAEGWRLRLLTYLPGTILAEARPHSAELLREVGRLLGRLDTALAGFSHPAAAGRNLLWNPERALEVVGRHAGKITDPKRRALVDHFVAEFGKTVTPRSGELPRSVIHNDANDYNVLVGDPAPGARALAGLLDFGDMVETWTVCELAVAIAYAIFGKPDPLAAACALAAGYDEVRPLSEAELAVLWPLCAMRLCTSVCLSAQRRAAEPENSYLTVSEAPAWEALARLEAVHPRLGAVSVAGRLRPDAVPPDPRGRSLARGAPERDGPGRRGRPESGRSSSTSPSGAPTSSRPTQATDVDAMTARLFGALAAAGAELGIGRYDEARLLYASDAFAGADGEHPERRTIHLAIDLFREAGSPVYGAAARHGPQLARQRRSSRLRADGDPGARPGGRAALLHPLRPPRARLARGPVRRYGGRARPAHRRDRRRRRKTATGRRTSTSRSWPTCSTRDGNFPGVAAASERATWLSLCPDPNLILAGPARFRAAAEDPGRLARERRKRMGPSLSLAYRAPLEILRGFGAFLYDQTGRAYLDMVNNVAHVGHGHPRVVRAGARQMAVLNTNTRYLHPSILRYAAAPDRDAPGAAVGLLLRLLRKRGQRAGAANGARRDIRPTRRHRRRRRVPRQHADADRRQPLQVRRSRGRGRARLGPRGPDAGRLPRPLPPGRSRPRRRISPATCGRRPRRSAPPAIGPPPSSARACSRAAGRSSCRPGYLAAAYRHAREAGAVCIADEVQVGFGRVGTRFWGFETQGVVPDIVTLGKPMGNGHPLGAVVTTPAIAAAFANGMEYFNTFGGNPVSCEIGLAVLDVIAAEGLQQRALQVGSRLKNGLAGLRERHAVVGDVRGLGLFLGIELVLDRETRAPAASQAAYVVERMKDHGILVSTDGPDHNVIKMKPPLPFSESDADRVVAAYERVLSEDFPRWR